MSLEDAAKARDEGLAQVAGERSREYMKKVRRGWIIYATEWMTEYLQTHDTMFPDELWDQGLEDWGLARKISGAAVRQLSRDGVIEQTGVFLQRSLGHCAMGPLWRATRAVSDGG